MPDFASSDFEREYGRHFAVDYPSDGFAELKERLVEGGAELIEPIRDPNGYIFEMVDANYTPEV